jgi:glycosyltransferase involved in cell wall biosynthesis
MVVFGGAERMTFAALGALVEGGAAVHCILNGWAYERIAREAEAIGAAWSTSAYRERLDLRTRNPLRHARQIRDHIQVSWDLLRQLLKTRATHVVVPAHDIVIRNWPVLLLARLAGRPVIMMLHNAPEATRVQQRLWRWIVNPVVSRFVCNSRFTRSALMACGVRAGKVDVVYYTSPRRREAEAEADPRDRAGDLIFVGQVIPPKGLHVLLEAVAELSRRGLDATLDVVGDVDGWISPAYGNYRDTIKARAARPDLQGRVRFLGWREDVPGLVRRALIHCCPSMPEQREAFGLVVLEAKAAGVPSVVFPSGALGEIVVHDRDGLVCAEPTAAALADACDTLLRQPSDRERLARGARESAGRFAPEAFAQAWRRLVGIDTPERGPHLVGEAT